MINDAQTRKLSDNEKKLLAYLGLDTALEMLEGKDKQAVTMDEDHSDGDIASVNKCSLSGAEKVFSSFKEP
jgi:hypothetical protein